MDLVIIGAGGHGYVVKDVALSLNEYNNIYFLDDKPGKDVYGPISMLDTFNPLDVDVFVSIGNPKTREKIVESVLYSGYRIPSLISPKTTISRSAMICDGCLICPGAVINANAFVGFYSFISANAIVDHNAKVGNYSHINCGSIVASNVEVEKYTKVDYNEVRR